MQAQNYSQLWDTAREAFNNDLPKSALTPLHAIRDKAMAESNTPQLLRALATEFTVMHEISPDSDAVVVSRIETILASETRPVERALWQNVLGQLTQSRELLLASVSDPQLLSRAKASDYVPAFAIGKDSRWMNDDLLSVLTMAIVDYRERYYRHAMGIAEADRLTYTDRMAVFNRMRSIYAEQHNAEATLMTDLYAFDHGYDTDVDEGALIARIRSLAPTMRHGGNAAKVLTAWADERECPRIDVRWKTLYDAFAPGTAAQAIIDSRNVSRIEVRLYRIKGLTNSTFDEDADRTALLKSKSAVLVATYKKSLRHIPAHESFADTIGLTLPAAGVYVAQLIADGKPHDTQWLHISRVAPMFFSSASEAGARRRLTLVDVVTGRPYTEDVTVKIAQDNDGPRYGRLTHRPTQWRTLQPEADGSFDLSAFSYRDFVAVSAGADCYAPTVSLDYLIDQRYHSGDVTEVLVRTFTDRAIYRPGQTVKFSTLVYSREGDSYAAQPAWKGKAVLQDVRREDIAEIDITTDDMGQCSGEFVLPDPVLPGSFAIVVRGGAVRHTDYFKVEEYKRPTFRVILDAPDSKSVTGRERWEVGDTITINGRVETYSGVAVPEATVRYATERSRWFWYRGDDDNSPTEQADTLTTDAEGRFAITLVLADEGHYRTSVEATASNGETASASHSLYVGTPIARRDDTESKPEWATVTHSADRSEATISIRPAYLTESDMDDATVDARVTPDEPLYLFVDITSTAGGLLSSRRMVVSDSLDLPLKWVPAYGDGATLHVAFVRHGQCVTTTASVIKPHPDKRLNLAWSTFRDHLQPGETETWSLTVLHPDGTPAAATVMARLYDASLDAFATDPWRFALTFDRSIPDLRSRYSRIYNSRLNYMKSLPAVGQFDLTRWEPTMFDYYSTMKLRSLGFNSTKLYSAIASPAAASGVAREEAAEMDMKMADATADSVMEEAAAAEDVAEAQSMQVRENFDETAFFLPALRTDADGRVTIDFTLPESLTQWNFTAFAHDAAMNYGLLNDTVVAQKMIMAEIAAPRFLRQGDKTELPVSVRNLTDAPQQAEVVCLVTDAATGRVLATQKRTVRLAAAKTAGDVANFAFPMTATVDVKVRVVAKTPDYSDGEERLVPVLSGRELIQVSVPFSLTKPGQAAIDLSSLHLDRLMKQDAECRPQLTVEYCDNPLWSVVRVLPALLKCEADYATQWATRLYAIEVADYLARQLHGTPAAELVDSLLATADIPALRYQAYDRLGQFQRGDGGFCWFAGFESSYWMTTDVCVLLARQQRMTGSTTARPMLDRAVAYLAKQTAELVASMKRDKQPWLGEAAMRYLYVRQLLDLQPDDDAKYLLRLASKEKKDLTMYGKSVAAQILSDSYPAESRLALQSLIEHTVHSDEMGRYFDTERALGGWASYKIPTQTMAIETLGLHGYDGDNDRLQSEMKLWLLQSKRTQQWDNSRASADATYALLHGDYSSGAEGAAQLFQSLTPEGTERRVLSDADAARAIKTHSWHIDKGSSGLSWGAVYADYSLPVDQVEQSSAGFTLTRQWEVKRNGKWQPATGGLKVGEHVRQVITLKADRDYDYVQVECGRAACMEPVHPLSGTTWAGGTYCYRMVRDSRNDYYFEHLAKGTHTFTEELIIDRAGTYSSGIARVISTYAPEFRAFAPSAPIFATSE